MTFIPGIGPVPSPTAGGGAIGGMAPVGDSAPSFNATLDQLAQPEGQSGPEFPTLMPPATSLSQPSDIPGMQPQLGPTAPGAVTSAGQLFKPLADWLGEVNSTVQKANGLERSLAEGDDVNLQDVMVASEKAGIDVSLVTQIRNKVLDAYTELLHMQV